MKITYRIKKAWSALPDIAVKCHDNPPPPVVSLFLIKPLSEVVSARD